MRKVGRIGVKLLFVKMNQVLSNSLLKPMILVSLFPIMIMGSLCCFLGCIQVGIRRMSRCFVRLVRICPVLTSMIYVSMGNMGIGNI